MGAGGEGQRPITCGGQILGEGARAVGQLVCAGIGARQPGGKLICSDAAEEMLSVLLGDGKDLLPLKRLIIERTEGTPFFMEEIVQALFEDGVLQRDSLSP